MKSKLMFGAYLACFMVLLSDAKTQTQAQEKGESAPAAKIIEAKFAGRLNAVIHAQSLEAPDEHKWLMLTVELTSLGKTSSLPADQIRVSDDSSGEYPALAIDYLTKKRRDPIFYFFKNRGALTTVPRQMMPQEIRGVWSPVFDIKSGKSVAECFFEEGNSKKMALCVSRDQETSTVQLELHNKTAPIALLFAVPASTDHLYFQIGKEPKIPVPLAKKAEQPAAESAPPSTADASTEKAPRVRIAGLYYADVSATPGDPLYTYFRFYADSSGLTFCCTTGKPAVVARWLNKDHERVEEGAYKLEETTLKMRNP